MESVLEWFDRRPLVYGLALGVLVCLVILPVALLWGKGWEQPIPHCVAFGLTVGVVGYIKGRKAKGASTP